MKLFKNNFHHTNRVEKISFKLDIPEQVIEETLDIMYEYIRMKLEAVDIDSSRILSEEEFDENFPIIAVPSLGFFKPNYRKYKHIMKNKLKKDELRKSKK